MTSDKRELAKDDPLENLVNLLEEMFPEELDLENDCDALAERWVSDTRHSHGTKMPYYQAVDRVISLIVQGGIDEVRFRLFLRRMTKAITKKILSTFDRERIQAETYSKPLMRCIDDLKAKLAEAENRLAVEKKSRDVPQWAKICAAALATMLLSICALLLLKSLSIPDWEVTISFEIGQLIGGILVGLGSALAGFAYFWSTFWRDGSDR